MNENNTCIFDTYTDADWDALYAAYLEDQGTAEVPETLEWGLRQETPTLNPRKADLGVKEFPHVKILLTVLTFGF